MGGYPTPIIGEYTGIVVRLAIGMAVMLTAAYADGRPVLAAFGDSITEGFGVEAGLTYPAQLQRALEARGLRWRVVNAGVSGDTTGNALDRLPQVIAQKPRVVILEIGGNDGLRGLPVTATRANLDELITGLKKAGATVLLVGMTLPANYGGGYIRQFEQLYRELAARHGVRLVDVAKAGVAGVPGMMQRDGIHPTAAGYRQLVKYLLPFVEEAIRGR
jgi:acyl-CoA thioesterase-1